MLFHFTKICPVSTCVLHVLASSNLVLCYPNLTFSHLVWGRLAEPHCYENLVTYIHPKNFVCEISRCPATDRPYITCKLMSNVTL